MSDDVDEASAAVWCRSAVLPDGSYGLRIDGPDVSFGLTRERAAEYAAAAIGAATAAEHDAAVYTQLRKLGVPIEATAVVLGEQLRPARQAARDEATRPLRFVTVLAESGRPSVNVSAGDSEPFTQWAPADVRDHALNVLIALAAADLDQAYLAVLTREVGLDENRARAAVADLGNHWPDEQLR